MTRRDLLAGATAFPALLQAQSEEGFVPLFDGKTWPLTVQEGPESAFKVDDGAIVVDENAGFPTWLRSARQYENFDFRGEFFIKGWIDSGIYFSAPEHGRPMWCGFEMHLFQQADEKPGPQSMGAIFPVVAPLKINVRNKGEWNTFRISMDWPRLRIWTNGEPVQDLDVESVPELRYRLRRGYLGLQSLSYPIRFRNLRVRELPAEQKWQTLYDTAADMGKWVVSEGRRQGEVRAAGRRPARRRLRPPGHAREVPRLRIAALRPARAAPQQRHSVPHQRRGAQRAPLRDPASRRGRGALSHGVALLLQAFGLPAHRGREVVARCSWW